MFRLGHVCLLAPLLSMDLGEILCAQHLCGGSIFFLWFIFKAENLLEVIL